MDLLRKKTLTRSMMDLVNGSTENDRQLAMALMDKLSNLEVELKKAGTQAELIQKRLQDPLNNGDYETTMWEIKTMKDKASIWLEHLRDALFEVLKQIHRFKLCQQKEGIGHVRTINLDEVQKNCDCLERLLRRLYYLVDNLYTTLVKLGPMFGENNPHNELKEIIRYMTDNIWPKLLQSSIVIEKHPPQIIKTNKEFKTNIRLLLSSLRKKVVPSLLEASKSCPKVAVYLLYEPQALELQRPFTIETIKGNQWIKVKSKGDTGCFEYDVTTKRLTASFNKLELENVKRTSARGHKKVAEEKLFLLFRVEGADLQQQLQTLSLPVVIISHDNQGMFGEPTIIWDNAFRTLAFCPHFEQPCTRSACIQAYSCVVPVEVPWVELALILRVYFNKKVDCDFSDDDMEHLREKIFSVSSPTDDMVTWEDFAKEPLPEKIPLPAESTLPTKFTFWGWFRGLIKLMEQHDGVIARMWRNKLIMGLITSSTSLRLLSGRDKGTFVLRPSSYLEYFSADVLAVKKPEQPHQKRREYIRTFSYVSNDYPKKSLADWVLEVDEMKRILHQTSSIAHPKRDVLAEYIKKGKEATVLPNGYEKIVTVCKVSKTPDPAEENGSDMPPNQRTTDSADSMDMETETAISSGDSEYTLYDMMEAPKFPPLSGPSVPHPTTTSVCSPQLGLPAYSPQPGSGVFSHKSRPTVVLPGNDIVHSEMSSISEYSTEFGSITSLSHSDINAFSPEPEWFAFSPQPGSSAFSPQPGPSAFSPQPGSFVSSPQPETIVLPRSEDFTSIQQNINGLSTGISNLEVSFGTTVSMLPSDSNSAVPGNQNRGSIPTEQYNMFVEIPPSTSGDFVDVDALSLLDDAQLQLLKF